MKRKTYKVEVKDGKGNDGKPVYPDRARVWFGKTSYVEVGYQRRKYGTFYAILKERYEGRIQGGDRRGVEREVRGGSAERRDIGVET